MLFDGETLAPAAVLDGIGLTDLRTSAVSALAVRHLAAREPRRLVVFGIGPQARAHVRALRAIAPIEHVALVGRDRGRTEALARELGAEPAGPDAVGAADVICCCTTAREPLFDGDAVADDAAVVAIGSHEPEAREVDERLAGRATVVVESRASALREAGDVIQAIGAGALREDDLVPLAALVRGEARPAEGRPRLFKSTGHGLGGPRARRRRARRGLIRRTVGRVPVSVVFTCDVCGRRPDPETQASLQRQLLDLRHGEYVDADPGRWLTWHGRGIYGPTRYACGEHRGELKALLREEYGTVGPRPWDKGPHPWAGRRGTDRARRLARGLSQSFGR